MAAIIRWGVLRMTDLYLSAQPYLLPIVEYHLIPDAVIRFFVRREIDRGHQRVLALTSEERQLETLAFIKELKTLPIAVQQHKANEQHYEVPDEFYQLVLGPRLKYSSGLWATPRTTLAESEVAMLELYCERAGLVDGMTIIDLGCGWGSVTLFVAEKYPKCRVTGISNSNSQREYILATAKQRGLSNVQVLTGDINTFDVPAEMKGQADRVISIEMFEHMKNYQLLMAKVSAWLRPGGKLFVHIFTGRMVPEHYNKVRAMRCRQVSFAGGFFLPFPPLRPLPSTGLSTVVLFHIHLTPPSPTFSSYHPIHPIHPIHPSLLYTRNPLHTPPRAG